MANLLVSSKICRFSYIGRTRTTINNAMLNNVSKNQVQVTQINRGLVEELELCLNSSNNYSGNSTITNTTSNNPSVSCDPMNVAKLCLIMEAVADRIEMHKNVGEQRNNWNHLLLSSVNMMTLSAAAMAGLAASGSGMAPLKVSSTILYMAATGLLAVMNCIQPSQLAEEQRNAARLFKKLHGELRTRLALGNPTASDVEDAMKEVMALDKAFPLPLLGAMLEKFPQTVEPAVWWPQRKKTHHGRMNKGLMKGNDNNGWDGRLEKEMREVARIVKKKDMADYLRLGKRVLRLNKLLAVSGPVLTGLAALGSACSSSMNHGGLMVGVICGALASVLNTLEHGGQVGMVFELYRGTAGFFKLMEESIEVNVNERDPVMRENGELFEIKVALQLGRTLSELRQFADCYECDDEFASKLF